MPDSILVALIAAFVALTGHYLSNFVKVEYDRWQKVTALAAAIAGELSAHRHAVSDIRRGMTALRSRALRGRLRMPSRDVKAPTDRVYEAAVKELGLLGSHLAESVAYVYANLDAFRLSAFLVLRVGGEMEPPEVVARVTGALTAIDRAEGASELLVPQLKALAARGFWSWWLRRRAAPVFTAMDAQRPKS